MNTYSQCPNCRQEYPAPLNCLEEVTCPECRTRFMRYEDEVVVVEEQPLTGQVRMILALQDHHRQIGGVLMREQFRNKEIEELKAGQEFLLKLVGSLFLTQMEGAE